MGAWAEGPYENDTAQDWLGGLSDHLKFLLMQACWSRYEEEARAAAGLLVILPGILTDKMGPHVYAEAIERLEVILADKQGVAAWKDPQRFRRSMRGLLKRLKTREARLQEAVQEAEQKFKKMTVKVFRSPGTRKPRRKKLCT